MSDVVWVEGKRRDVQSGPMLPQVVHGLYTPHRQTVLFTASTLGMMYSKLQRNSGAGFPLPPSPHTVCDVPALSWGRCSQLRRRNIEGVQP